MSPAEDKQALRKRCAERRRQASAAAGDKAGMNVAEQALANIPFAAVGAVSGYWPIRDEIDPRPLMLRLVDAGHACALPVVKAGTERLDFRLWSPGMALEPNVFGIPEPPAGVGDADPEVLLVPLLAFDAAGYRLGYGGGYYDRTLAGLRGAGPVLTIGIAFAIGSGLSGAATSATINEVVTDELCINVVARIPTISAKNGFSVASKKSSRTPLLSDLKPSPRPFTPTRKTYSRASTASARTAGCRVQSPEPGCPTVVVCPIN